MVSSFHPERDCAPCDSGDYRVTGLAFTGLSERSCHSGKASAHRFFRFSFSRALRALVRHGLRLSGLTGCCHDCDGDKPCPTGRGVLCKGAETPNSSVDRKCSQRRITGWHPCFSRPSDTAYRDKRSCLRGSRRRSSPSDNGI